MNENLNMDSYPNLTCAVAVKVLYLEVSTAWSVGRACLGI